VYQVNDLSIFRSFDLSAFGDASRIDNLRECPTITLEAVFNGLIGKRERPLKRPAENRRLSLTSRKTAGLAALRASLVNEAHHPLFKETNSTFAIFILMDCFCAESDFSRVSCLRNSMTADRAFADAAEIEEAVVLDCVCNLGVAAR
jgi:hypothetical protein